MPRAPFQEHARKTVPEADGTVRAAIENLMVLDRELEAVTQRYDDARGVLLGLLPAGSDAKVGDFVVTHIAAGKALAPIDGKWQAALKAHNLDPAKYERWTARVELTSDEIATIINACHDRGLVAPASLGSAEPVLVVDDKGLIGALEAVGKLDECTQEVPGRKAHIRTRWAH